MNRVALQVQTFSRIGERIAFAAAEADVAAVAATRRIRVFISAYDYDKRRRRRLACDAAARRGEKTQMRPHMRYRNSAPDINWKLPKKDYRMMTAKPRACSLAAEYVAKLALPLIMS